MDSSHRPLLASLVAVPTGLALALLSPSLALLPEPLPHFLNFAPLVLTAAVIVWNLVAAVRVFARTGLAHLAWPFTLAQFCLFTLLFFQISCHLGAEHFRWTRTPGPMDWLQFSTAHALRAGDLFDYIEAYGLDLQPIHHVGPLAACSLLAFHLVLDLFFISILLELLSSAFSEVARAEEALAEEGLNIRLAVAGNFLLLLVPAWLLTALWLRPWRREDLYLWPLDNLLQVLDIGDAVPLFGLRMSQVPNAPWEATLTAACRTLFGLILCGLAGRVAAYLSLHTFGGFGMTRESLERLRDGGEAPAVRELAAGHLRSRGPLRPVADLRGWGVAHLALGATLAAVLLAWPFAWPAWGETASTLAVTACSHEHPDCDRALAALRRMGSHARPAAASLAAALAYNPERRQPDLVAALILLGETGEQAVGEVLRSGPPRLAIPAVELVRRRGPHAAGVLACGLQSAHGEVRDRAESALFLIGTPSLGPVADAMDEKNAVRCIDLLDRISPEYWPLQPSRNPVYVEATRLPGLIAGLSASSANSRLEAIAELRTLGGLARLAIPSLALTLNDPEGRVGYAAEAALSVIDPDWRAHPSLSRVVPLIAAALDSPKYEIRTGAIRALGCIGPASASAVPSLIRMLSADRPEVGEVVGTLIRMGAAARAAGPALLQLADDGRIRATNAERLFPEAPWYSTGSKETNAHRKILIDAELEQIRNRYREAARKVGHGSGTGGQQ